MIPLVFLVTLAGAIERIELPVRPAKVEACRVQAPFLVMGYARANPGARLKSRPVCVWSEWL